MSSTPSDFEISTLENFGKSKKPKTVSRRIRKDHGAAIVSLPESILKEIGYALDADVRLVAEFHPNPLERNIRVEIVRIPIGRSSAESGSKPTLAGTKRSVDR